MLFQNAFEINVKVDHKIKSSRPSWLKTVSALIDAGEKI